MPRKPEETLKYLDGKKKLSPTELSFMEYIWSHPEGINSKEIYEHFPQARGTKSTILYNISEKGYVEKIQQGLHHIYTPLITKEQYEQALCRQQLKSAFGDTSFERLIAAFCGKSHLTEKQKKKVGELLEELKNGVDDQ